MSSVSVGQCLVTFYRVVMTFSGTSKGFMVQCAVKKLVEDHVSLVSLMQGLDLVSLCEKRRNVGPGT